MLGKIRALWKDVTDISLLVESSRGIFAGPDFDTLDELQPDPINTYGGLAAQDGARRDADRIDVESNGIVRWR